MCRTCLAALVALCLALHCAAPLRAQTPPAGGSQPSAPVPGQQTTPPAPLDKQSEKIKRAVAKIGIGERITVIIKGGHDLHGTVTQTGADAFLLAEVDRHEVLTVLYRDVEKVRKGYGGVNLFTGKHGGAPPRGARIAAAAGVLFVALALPLILVAASKD